MTILVAGDPVPEARERRGDFPELIRRAAGEGWSGPWGGVDLRTTDTLPTLAELAAVVITGSAASVTDGEFWMRRAAAYVRELAHGGVPVLGICFGHQLLAQALGGRVARNPFGREIGSVRLELTEVDEVFGARSPIWVNSTHVDSVVELPSGARSFGRTALEPNAAVKFAPSVWGVQYHPEIDAEVIRYYVRARADQLRREAFDVAALEREALDTPDGVAVIQNFVRVVMARERARAPR